jgi:hypothetical protein
MSLPKNIIPDLKGLMCVFENANGMSLSAVSCVSHDSLARVLTKEKFVGKHSCKTSS